MKIKSRPQDFRVQELLAEGYLERRGKWRVYRVTKKKLTSFEAARALANLARVEPSDVGMAGLKDRQGITTQYMSVLGGREVRWTSAELKIEQVGFAMGPLTSGDSEGNAFEVTLRGLTPELAARVKPALAEVREHGFVNYFGEQRFGNLRFGQGWIARDLARGELEVALKNLLCGRSAQDDERHAAFKRTLESRWGNWRACREIAGAFGAHHSVFEVLAKDPEDLHGAWRRVAARLRLIHLFAWQSHVWNRAVDRYVHTVTPRTERQHVDSIEGELTFARGAVHSDPAFQNRFRLPGVGLEDVEHAKQKELFTAVLREEGVAPREFRIEGIGGFQLKGEERDLVVWPRLLRAFESERDPGRVTLAFELPRGSYATVLVARLLGRSAAPYAPRGFEEGRGGERDEDDDGEERELPSGRAGRPSRGQRDERAVRGDRGTPAEGPASEPDDEDDFGPEEAPRAPRRAPFLPPKVGGRSSRARKPHAKKPHTKKRGDKDKGKPIDRRNPGRKPDTQRGEKR